jgi:serine/threonine protein kinase
MLAAKVFMFQGNLNQITAQAEYFKRELEVLCALQGYDFIVPVLGASMTERKMVLLMAYAEGGTVSDLVTDEVRFAALETKDKLRMLSEIAWAMASLYQHDPPIVHRDLKSANILLDAKGTCLLADFGLAKKLTEFTETFTMAGGAIGSPAWSSPEYLDHDHQGEKSDVWSWAVIATELFTGKPPWHGLTPLQIIAGLQHGKRPPMPTDGVPRALTKLVKRCWAARVSARPSFLEILSSLDAMAGREGVRLIAVEGDQEQEGVSQAVAGGDSAGNAAHRAGGAAAAAAADDRGALMKEGEEEDPMRTPLLSSPQPAARSGRSAASESRTSMHEEPTGSQRPQRSAVAVVLGAGSAGLKEREGPGLGQGLCHDHDRPGVQ